jgi:hypothetical protein
VHFICPIFANRRLQRFHRWALLWLTWLAAVLDNAAAYAPLSQQVKTLTHAYLDQIARVIVSIVMIRASYQVRQLPPKHWSEHVHACKVTSLRRAVMGVKLWRELRHRDVRQRIAALRQDIDALTARVARRLPRGLTRRRPIHTRPESRVIDSRAAVLTPKLAADTS